jgi:protein gp37
MADETNIEWCDSTFNPWIGCTRVSPACDDCYAARSTPARTLGVAWGAGEQRRRTAAANWQQPKTWQRRAFDFQFQHGRRRRVFCASLADVFDNEVPGQWRIELMRLIVETPDLDWLLLTKRIGNAAGMLETAFRAVHQGREGWADNVPPNVWIGATVVNQAEADRDLPKLQRVPAAVRFLSIEPMLGPIDLGLDVPMCAGLDGRHVDWVICGGESGPKARPMHPDWARSLRDQCAAAGVPFLFKQHGEWIADDDIDSATLPPPQIADPDQFFTGHAWGTTHSWRVGKKAAGRQLDGRTHDAWPEVQRG